MIPRIDCPSCGARMALEPDTRFCNGCSRIVNDAQTERPLGTLAAPVKEASAVCRQTLAIIVSILLASCASQARAVAVTPQTVWTLPLSAQDNDQVCVIVMEYPGRRCTTASELRAYVRSVKAD